MKKKNWAPSNLTTTYQHKFCIFRDINKLLLVKKFKIVVNFTEVEANFDGTFCALLSFERKKRKAKDNDLAMLTSWTVQYKAE